MVKYKTGINFRTKKENKTFKAGVPFEMTIERAEEVQKDLKEMHNLDVTFERVDTEDDSKDLESKKAVENEDKKVEVKKPEPKKVDKKKE